jgi:chromosome segregation ATPase
MSALEVAEGRLDAALARLEDAVRRRSDRPAAADEGGIARHVAELAALGEECERLRLALAEAQAQKDELEQRATTVGDRLDHAIGELGQILEG